MFLEVCLLSLGLFTGSELYKKIEASFGGKPHNCGLRKKHEQPVRSAEAQENGKIKRSFTPEQAEVSSALEALTQEVSGLRDDFAEYLAVNKGAVNKAAVDKYPVRNSEAPPATAQQSTVPHSSIFEKLIKENVTLREGKTG